MFSNRVITHRKLSSTPFRYNLPFLVSKIIAHKLTTVLKVVTGGSLVGYQMLAFTYHQINGKSGGASDVIAYFNALC